MGHVSVGTITNSGVFAKVNRLTQSMSNFKLQVNQFMRQNSSHYVYDYHKDVETAINKQIKHEHQAAMGYLCMAMNFLRSDVSYIGAGNYFMKMYKEELQHMESLIKYQLKRGGMPTMTIDETNKGTSKENLTLVAAFTEALQMEGEISKHLQNIVSIAEAMKDYQCADFITSKFLEEQIRSIHELTHHVTVLNRLCDNEPALWQFDQHLLKSCKSS